MVAKARLVEIEFDANQQQFNPVANGKSVTVHFNPESLKVSFSNENRGGNQPGGGGGQFVGSGTSKMSVELFFDTTEATGDVANRDVRRITEQVVYFVKAKPPSGSGNSNTNSNRVPPGLSFEWGSFIFRGVVNSMDETLDYFSEEGIPMRATVSLNITRQEIKFEFGEPGQASGGAAAGGPPPGTQPMDAARQGDSVQSMAAREGRSSDWKQIAAANGIDDPLRLEAGALVNLNAGASFGAGISASGGVSGGLQAGAGFGVGAAAGASVAGGLSASGQVGFSAGLGGGVGFSAGVGASAGASAGFGASAGAGASAGFGASASAGASAGFGASAGAGASAGIGASAGVGVSAGFGASANAGLSGGAGGQLLEV